MMCGATQQQSQLADAQQAFYTQMTQSYTTEFNEQQDVLGALTKSLSPIIAAGIGQEGFGAEEKQALNTQATEGTAQNYAMAQKSLNEHEAALGGTSDMTMEGGGEKQLSGELAGTAAATRSSEGSQIIQADYDTGRTNYTNAVGELESASSQMNPTGYSSAATGAGTAASNTANQIAEESNSVWTSVMGGLSGIAGAAISENPGNMFG